MKQIEIQGQTGRSVIAVGESLEKLEKYVHGTKPVIITDENLESHYKNQFPPWDTVTIGTGEKIKTLDTMEYIYEKLVEHEIDRSCFLVGIGTSLGRISPSPAAASRCGAPTRVRTTSRPSG